MATYVNDLRLKEIATGDESGTWGTSTNTNLELIAEAFSYASVATFDSDADKTETIADGATDPYRSLYVKVTSGVSLTATRTLTIAPNTVSKVWIIENATSGSQSISISQGSGANVTIPNGDVKVIYSDGAGSGAAVVDAFANLKVTDAAQTNITSVGTLSSLTVSGAVNNMTIASNGSGFTCPTSQNFIINSPNGLRMNIDSNNDGTTENFTIGHNQDTAASTNILFRIGEAGKASIGHGSANANLHIGDANATGDTTNPALQIGGASTYRLGMYTSTEGGVIENKNGDDGIQFKVKTAGEAMRIDGGTGNVLIGKTATGGNTAGMQIIKDSFFSHVRDDGVVQVLNRKTSDGDILKFEKDNSTVGVIGSQNWGIAGVPPSDVNTGYPLLSIGETTVVQGLNDSNESFFSNNAIFRSDSSWEYVKDVRAAQMLFADGTTIFRQAASGTAGNDITWSESMRIDTSNKVGISTTDPDYLLTVGDAGTGSETILQIAGGTSSTGNIFFGDVSGTGAGSYSGYIQYDHGANAMIFGTSSAERARIASNGRTSIGTTTTNAGLTVANGDVRATGAAFANDANSISMSYESGSVAAFTARGPSTSTRASMVLTVSRSNGSNGISAVRIENDGKTIIGTDNETGAVGVLEVRDDGADPIFVVHKNSTGVSDAVVIRHGRGLSGFSGTGIDFQRNDGTTVGTVVIGFTSTAYNTTSDYRLKENVNYTWDATTRLKQLKPARFNFIEETGTTVDGFLAHEVSSVVPQAVTGEKDAVDGDGNPEHQSIDHSKLVPLLVKTIQELEARITALES